jgi:TolA-binding protein
MEKLLTHWPAYKDADKGWYCLGLSRLALGQPDKARAALERVLSEFSQSPVVSSAKQALAKIGEK